MSPYGEAKSPVYINKNLHDQLKKQSDIEGRKLSSNAERLIKLGMASEKTEIVDMKKDKDEKSKKSK